MTLLRLELLVGVRFVFYDDIIRLVVIVQIVEILIHETLQEALVAAQAPVDFLLQLSKLGESLRLGFFLGNFRSLRFHVIDVFLLISHRGSLVHIRYRLTYSPAACRQEKSCCIPRSMIARHA